MAKQYLDKDGVQQVWNAVDSKFMRSSGTATRPTYNGNDLALYSDIPSTAKNLYQHIVSMEWSGGPSGSSEGKIAFVMINSQSTSLTIDYFKNLSSEVRFLGSGTCTVYSTSRTVLEVIFWGTSAALGAYTGKDYTATCSLDYVTSFTDIVSLIQ